MPPSLGLTLYNLRRQHEASQAPDRPPRPEGRLVWLHLPDPTAGSGMLELARRLIEDDGLSVLVTSAVLPGLPDGLLWQPPPVDTTPAVTVFLDYWQPEIVIFADGELRPALINAAAARKLPLLMADARAPALLSGRDGWFPGLMRRCLAAFTQIAALDEAAAKAFRKAGAPGAAVVATGRMAGRSAALPCHEAERQALAQILATRPLWFAAAVPEAEELAVLAAHRAVHGQLHRLLLILLPAEPERACALAAAAEADGWSVALRSAEQDPELDKEIYIVDSPAELGLWYRLAPITFLGGSLSGTGSIRNPLEPAALGTAILHGPRAGAFADILGRLGAARGARAVASASDLSDALGDLMSPDRAARLAQAAWAVASDGVDATETVLGTIRRLLDEGP